MNRLIFAIAAMLYSAPFLFALNGSAGSGTGIALNASIVTLGNASYSTQANAQSVHDAEQYVIGKLGQSYYSSHISYYYGSSYKNMSYVYFTYNVPFSNGTNAYGTFAGQPAAQRLLGITVTLNKSDVVGYIGPSAPYIVIIPYAQAVNVSSQYGIENGSAGIEGMFSSNNIANNASYAVVWAVRSGAPLKSGIYHGVYIDAVTGAMVGEYFYNPSILAAQGGLSSYGTGGNFSMFYMTNSMTPEGTTSPDWKYIPVLIALAVICLAFGLYISRRR